MDLTTLAIAKKFNGNNSSSGSSSGDSDEKLIVTFTGNTLSCSHDVSFSDIVTALRNGTEVVARWVENEGSSGYDESYIEMTLSRWRNNSDAEFPGINDITFSALYSTGVNSVTFCLASISKWSENDTAGHSSIQQLRVQNLTP